MLLTNCRGLPTHCAGAGFVNRLWRWVGIVHTSRTDTLHWHAYSLCLAFFACMHRQPNDVRKDGNHHPIVAVAGRRRRFGQLAGRRRRNDVAAAAVCCRTHYARAYVRFIAGHRVVELLLLLWLLRVVSVCCLMSTAVAAAARLFVPQIAASVGVSLHAVELLAGGWQFAPLLFAAQLERNIEKKKWTTR